MADIEKAFLMISIDPKDRDVLRFLWVKNPQLEEPEIVTYRFSRVVFGVSSSPFLLNATIQHHVKKYAKEQPSLVEKISESMMWLEVLKPLNLLISSTKEPSRYSKREHSTCESSSREYTLSKTKLSMRKCKTK